MVKERRTLFGFERVVPSSSSFPPTWGGRRLTKTTVVPCSLFRTWPPCYLAWRKVSHRGRT